MSDYPDTLSPDAARWPGAPLTDEPGFLSPVDVKGSTVPRIFTPPRWGGPPGPCGCGCALRPATSRGFEIITFATDVLRVALLPWQRWWLIHAFELSLDVHPITGRRRLRFRTLLTLIARQQGKSWIMRVVALWALYVRGVGLVLGAAQSLDIAREAWLGAVEMAQSSPECAAEIPAQGGVRMTNGEQCLTLSHGQRYRITAATRGAGRGLSVDVLLLDELREHRDYLAWAALSKTTLARPDALICAVSNAGDDQSVVLNDLRARAIDALARCCAEPLGAPGADPLAGIVPMGGDGASPPDPSGGLFLAEWSAPEGAPLDDPAAWRQAMPGLNIDVVGPRGWQPAPITTEAVLGFLATDPPNVFRTELLCIRVGALDTAFDPVEWAACADSSFTLRAARNRIAVCVDVALDGEHVTACGAIVLPDNRAGVAVLGAWSGRGAVAAAERVLPGILTAIRPIEIGWFPSSPVGALGPVLRNLRRTIRLALPKVVDDPKLGRHLVTVDESEAAKITAAMDREAAQGLAGLLRSRRLVHPADPLLDAQIPAAQRVEVAGGESGWRLTRRGGGHCDAAYAVAGAVFLARVTPDAPARPQRAQIF